MKHILYTFALLSLFSLQVNAQSQPRLAPNQNSASDIKPLYINEEITTVVILSEPIKLVDLSTKNVSVDMPLRNVVRLKAKTQTEIGSELGVLTLVTEKYVIQVDLLGAERNSATTSISLSGMDAAPIDLNHLQLTEEEFKEFSKDVIQKKPTYYRTKSKRNKASARLNNIYVVGDFFFIDVTFKNKTNIPYTIDQLRFKIEDRRVVKSTNYQSVEIPLAFKLYDQDRFVKRQRNVFVFKKFTFPNQKNFTIELTEEQISGRKVILEIDYRDILNADLL